MNAALPSDLFRREVADARVQRLEGEVMLTQPLRSSLLILFIVAIVAALAAWVVLGRYARSEMVPGILVTEVPSARIMAPRSGRVIDLRVDEGDLVRKGDLLAVIETEQPTATGTSALGESLAALEAQGGLARQQAMLADVRARTMADRLQATLGGLAAQRAAVSRQAALQEQVVASARQTLERIAPVMERGFVSEIEYERRRQALLGAEQQLSQLQSQAGAMAAQQRETLAELRRLKVDAATEIGTARTSVENVRLQQARIGAEQAYQIRASIAGRVTAVQAAPGRPVDPSLPLMTIVPDKARLTVQLFAPSRAVGFLEEGQEVRLLYDAFPYQRYGSGEATIRQVTRTAVLPNQMEAPFKFEEPVYRVEATLDRQSMAAFGKEHPLQAGMTLKANIILDRMSFGEWLLRPLMSVKNKSASHSGV